jgi:hypothetical protein
MKLTDHLLATCFFLKGPKPEAFSSRFFIFAQIRLVWVGDLRTKPKYSKF